MTNATLEKLKLEIDLIERCETISMAQKKINELKLKVTEGDAEGKAIYTIYKIIDGLNSLIMDLEDGNLPDKETNIYEIKSQLFRI